MEFSISFFVKSQKSETHTVETSFFGLFALTKITSLQTGVCRGVMYNENMGKNKTTKQMERHLKGMANHYRIGILLLVAERGAITLEDIVGAIGANEKTIGEHTRRLYQAGLINKKYRGKFVDHTLSPYGKTFANFLKSFQRV